MIELLIAVTILAVVSMIGVGTFRQANMRARDAERKRHLQEIKVGFEEYFNDNGCYPASTALDNCNGADLSPYIKQIPCDPLRKQPYSYIPMSNSCQGYRVYTVLESGDDEDVASLGCDGPTGCGYSLNIEYNYGVAVGTSVFYTP